MNIRPKAGFAFVKLDSKFLDQYGDIVIPDNVKQVPGKIGIVVAFTPYRDTLTTVFEQGHRVTKNMFCYNEIYKDLKNKRVVCDCGQLFSPTGRPNEKLYVVRLEHIALVMDNSVSAEQADIHYNGVPRCRVCKSAGEDNLILDSLGFCPQCGLNEKWQHRSQRDLGVCSDELSYQMHKREFHAIEHAKLSKKITTFGKGSHKKHRKVA